MKSIDSDKIASEDGIKKEMEHQIKDELLELGFDVNEEGFKLPKLSEINKNFRQLAFKKHSDKGGDDEQFIRLYDAWKKVCTLYNDMKIEELTKYDEGNYEQDESSA